jgi:hypothetical protein
MNDAIAYGATNSADRAWYNESAAVDAANPELNRRWGSLKWSTECFPEEMSGCSGPPSFSSRKYETWEEAGQSRTRRKPLRATARGLSLAS